jgi:hypothetical protein
MNVFSLRATIILTLITIMLGPLVYLSGIRKDGRESELMQIEASITETRDSITVLKSEWAYLSRPDRILQLSERFLDLKPLDPHQIVPVGELSKITKPAQGNNIEEANLIWSVE